LAREELFYNDFNSRFMPAEHSGIDPDKLLISFLPKDLELSFDLKKLIVKSKSPLYKPKKSLPKAKDVTIDLKKLQEQEDLEQEL